MSNSPLAASVGAWLIEETEPLGTDGMKQLEEDLALTRGAAHRGSFTPTLAVTLHDMVIHNNKKWFGDAEIRLDAVVVTGYGDEENPTSFFMPKTRRFPRVKDGQTLPIGEGGLLVFHGAARHFLDLFILVSRNRKDSEDLASLLSSELGSVKVQTAIGSLVGLAVAAPQAALVAGALGAASFIGEVTNRVLQAATGNTIGLFRGSYLEVRDNFGIGKHPEPPKKSFDPNDLSFSFQIDLE